MNTYNMEKRKFILNIELHRYLNRIYETMKIQKDLLAEPNLPYASSFLCWLGWVVSRFKKATGMRGRLRVIKIS